MNLSKNFHSSKEVRRGKTLFRSEILLCLSEEGNSTKISTVFESVWSGLDVLLCGKFEKWEKRIEKKIFLRKKKGSNRNSFLEWKNIDKESQIICVWKKVEKEKEEKSFCENNVWNIIIKMFF